MPPDRRSATLNLVYLPLYAAGIISPAAGAAGPFWLGAAVFLAGVIVVWLRVRPSATEGRAVETLAGRGAE